MQLEYGKRYWSFHKGEELVMGPTAVNPAWVWTLRGNWYEQATGRFIHTDPKTGEQGPVVSESWQLTQERVGEPDDEEIARNAREAAEKRKRGFR